MSKLTLSSDDSQKGSLEVLYHGQQSLLYSNNTFLKTNLKIYQALNEKVIRKKIIEQFKKRIDENSRYYLPLTCRKLRNLVIFFCLARIQSVFKIAFPKFYYMPLKRVITLEKFSKRSFLNL